MTSGEPILTADLPPGPGAARIARRAVAAEIAGLRVLDRVDLLVIASELAVALELDAPGCLTLTRTVDGYRVEVVRRGAGESLDPISASVLDELAVEWSIRTGRAHAVLHTSAALTGDEPENLLFAQVAEGDDAALEEIASRYGGLANAIAGRFSGGSLDRADLEQVARVGLLGAIDRFDPERGVRFTTFAARTIEGELKRHLRDSGWSVRVPRGLQELGLEAVRAQESFSQDHGREATLEEVAGEIGADPDEVARALEARRSFAAASLDAPVGGPDTPRRIDRIPAHDERLPLTPEWADVSEAMEDLDDRDRRILYLRFFEDLSQSEIAERVGISQMHVSRLLARALPRLRRIIEGRTGG